MAGQYKGITVEINGETTGLHNAMKGIDGDTKSLQKELPEVTRLLKLDPSSTVLQQQKTELLNRTYQNTAEKLRAMEQAQQKMNLAHAANADWERQFAPIKKEMDATSAKLKELRLNEARMLEDFQNGRISDEEFKKFQKTLTDTEQKSKELKARKKELDSAFENGHISDQEYRNFNRELEATRQNLQAISKERNPISSIGDSFQQIKQKAEELHKKLAPIEAGLKSLGSAMGTALSGMAKGFAAYSTAAAGAAAAVSTAAVKAGMDFDAQMSKVAAISGGDMEVLTAKAKEMGATTKFSATEAAQAMEYMAMAGWKTKDIGDGIGGIMNLAAASGENLAAVSDIVTDALTAFGKGADEAAGFADVLAAASANSNTNVSMMGESFRYAAPVAGALGYEAKDVSIALGLMANSSIKGSMAGTSLKTALANLASPTKAMSKAMKQYGISLTDSNGEMKPFIEVIGGLRESLGSLDEVQQTAAATTLFGKEAMAGMLAIVNASPEDYDKLTNAVMNSDEAAQRMAETMQDNLSGDITLLKSNLEGVSLSLSDRLSPALREGVQSFHQLVTAFSQGGASGAAEALQTMLPDLTKFAAENLPGLASEFLSVFNTAVMGIGQTVSALLPPILDSLLPALIGGFRTLITSLSDTLPALIPQLADGAVILFSSLLDILSDTAPKLTAMLPGVVQQISDTLLSYLPSMAENGAGFLMELGNGIVSALPALIPVAAEAAFTVVQELADNIPLLADCAIQLVTGLADGLMEAIPVLIKALPEIITGIVNGLLVMGPKLAECGVELLGKLAGNLPEIIQLLCNSLPELIIGIVNGFLQNAPQIAEAGVKLLGSLITDLPSIILTLLQAPVQIVEALVNGIAEHWDEMCQAGENMLKGVWEGMKNAASWLKDKIVGVFSNVVNGVKDFLGIHSPSRVFKNEIGFQMMAGAAEGVQGGGNLVSSSTKKVCQEALKTAKSAAAGYEGLGKELVKSFHQGIEDRAATSQKAVEVLVNRKIEEMPALNSKAKTEFSKAGKSLISSYQEAVEKGAKQAKDQIAESLQGVTKAAQQQYDELSKAQDSMRAKLENTAELFTIKDGEMKLSNLEKTNSLLEAYGNTLERLKQTGVSQDFLSEVASMGTEDGLRFASQLLSMQDGEFQEYLDAWEKNRILASEIAEHFYADQMETLDENFTEQLNKALKGVPQQVEGIGTQAAQGFIDGLNSRMGEAVGAARQLCQSVVEQFQVSLDIHSPSRVMRDKIAGNMVEGLTIGLNSGIGKVIASANGLSQGMINVFPQALVIPRQLSTGNTAKSPVSSGTNTKPNTITQNFYSTRPLSPAETQRQARRGLELAFLSC